MQIFIHRDGQQTGPYTLEQVRDMLETGVVKETELCWYEGLQGGRPLSEIAQFLPKVTTKDAPSNASTVERGALMDIGRDGEVIGSWTLKEIRSFLASGNLVGSDYYLEGEKWLPLSNLIPRQAPPPPPTSTGPAQSGVFQQQNIVTGQHEEEIWVGSPSQLLNLKFFFWWIVVLLIGSLAIPVLKVSAPDNLPLAVLLLVILFLIFAVSSLRRILKIWATRYVITSQRVKIIQGIFSKDVSELELFRVKDTMVHQSLFLRLFRLGNVTIISGDAKSPFLLLMAIPRAVAIRERLRQEILVLRQKLNVRETELM